MEKEREQMVVEIRDKYGLKSPEVFSVMLQIPRENFAPRRFRYLAYQDGPVAIGFGQTMSQPYTVAIMSDLIIANSKLKNLPELETLRSWKQKSKLRKNILKDKVLEIGTGSGYQAAILSMLFKKVYTVEIIRQLAYRAEKTLKKLKFNNVFVKTGSGEWGWQEKAPFDAIMITAGVEKVPEELFEQLEIGGVLVAPLGKGYDKVMTRFTKLKTGGLRKEEFGLFHFVPFVIEKN